MSGNYKIGLFSAVSIGIGGIIGGGIFAITGLTIMLSGSAAPIVFLVSGIIALLTCYAYAKLSVAYPTSGGTVSFIHEAFGDGVTTGAINMLLCISYIIMLALYAYAFGSYTAMLFPKVYYELLKHLFSSGILIFLALINWSNESLIVKSENLFNVIYLLLLLIFVVAGFFLHPNWSQLSPHTWPSSMVILSVAMVVFCNYEGFELIANASDNILNPKRNIPLAFYTSVLISIFFYISLLLVSIGHVSLSKLIAGSDYALAVSAQSFLGMAGFLMIVAAALLATCSAITATFFGAAKITSFLADLGQFPKIAKKAIRQRPCGGLIILTLASVLACNLLDIHALAVLASFGFLVVFMVVSIANIKLRKVTQCKCSISLLATLVNLFAIILLLRNSFINYKLHLHLWLIAGELIFIFIFELIMRRLYTHGKKS